MRRSIMSHSFANQPEISIPRSTFDRSHSVLTAFDSDFIIPVLIDEVMPGDTYNCELSYLARLSTPSFPVFTPIYLDIFYFFCPYRLLWQSWQKFMGEQIDPGDSISYTIPVITLDTDATALHGYLIDYFGLPLIDYNTSNYTCSALPVRAYNRIYNEWFRDENLQDSIDNGTNTGNGPDHDNADLGQIMKLPHKRGKRMDYYTSCLPWLQKGDAVELPLGTSADIDYYAHSDCGDAANKVRLAATDALQGAHNIGPDATGILDVEGSGEDSFIDPNGRWYADLTSATAATINEIRQAFQVQRFLEQSARVGTRYTEIIQGIYGISNAGGDARLNRPEYLGGSSNPISINPVAVTADTGNFEAGELAAVGTGYGKASFIKSFTEHGVILCLANVRIDQEYQCEGFEKFWHRSTRYDYYAPAFAHLGEMSVLNRELYLDDATITAGTDDDVFGYQMVWDDLRYKTSKITGIFRSNAAATLDVMHLAEEFGAEQALDSTFIVSNATEGLDRTLQTPAEPQIFFNGYFNLKCTRPMPVFSVPGLIDHL